jgi:hypothetical protein
MLRRLPPLAEQQEWNMQARTICSDVVIARNIGYALHRGFPEFSEIVPAHDRTVSICGSAPSLKWTLGDLTGDIWACNDAGWFLIEHGITPKYVMVWDPQPLVIDCLRRTHPDSIYLVASMCDPLVFDMLEQRGCQVMIWHPWFGDSLPISAWLGAFNAKSSLLVGFGLPTKDPTEVMGTSAAVTRSMQFAPMMGYRRMHVFGADSSCEAGVVHFDDLAIDKDQYREDVTIFGKTFISTPQMIRQIREFDSLMKMLIADGCKITIHGNGAIPWIAMLRGWHVCNVQPLVGAVA